MKTKSLLILAFLFSIYSVNAQYSQQCSHKTTIDKSWISDTLDAVSYTIHLNSFDFTNHEIEAQTDVELSSKINYLDEVKLELMDLTVEEVYVNGVLNTGFTHDGMILSIPLTSPVNTGETVNVSVSYHGEPFHEGWGGFHWSGEYCFNLGVGFVSIPHNLGKTWFPCIDDFHDMAF